MKYYISSLVQETNTFSPCRSDLELFRRGYLLRGEEIPQSLAGTNTEVGGFYQYFAGRPEVTLIPGTAAWAVASGPVTRDAFERIAGEILAGLKAAMPVDGVLLALHGALVGEGIDDCDGELLRRVRALVGPDLPVVCTLDYHANLTRLMLAQDCPFVGFRTYPHVDFAQTGMRAARLLEEMALTGLRPARYFQKLPLIVPVEDSETGRGVCREAVGRLAGLEREEVVLSGSLFCSQPWIDVPEAGVSALLYVKEKREDLGKQFSELCAGLLQSRERFFAHYPSIDEALDRVGSCEKPIVLVDSGDVTTAGGSGDSTCILRALLERGLPLDCALNVVDPATVSRAMALGEGATGIFQVGGSGQGFNRRVPVEARVLCLLDRRSQVSGQSFAGVRVDVGKRALLLAREHLYLVVSEYSSLLHDPQLLRDMGVRPEKLDLIVQKSHKLFRAAYQGIAKSVMILNTPGYSDQNLKRLPFRRVTRPVYPLDEIDTDLRACL